MAADHGQKRTTAGKRPGRRKTAGKGAADGRCRRTESRKERVLHTRVSEKLAEKITRAAEEMRVPASNLVRNVLEDAFSVMESMTDNVGDLIENMLDEAEQARVRFSRGIKHTRKVMRASLAGEGEEGGPGSWEGEYEDEEFPEIVAWQPLVLNQGRRCSSCGKDLARGERAMIGISSDGLTETYLCAACMAARR